MKPKADIRAEIEAGERWLAEQFDRLGPVPAEPPVEAVRRRTAVALGEQWLAGQMGPRGQSMADGRPPIPADLTVRVKQTIRRELGQLDRPEAAPTVLTHPRFTRWRRWAGSVAAMIAFALVIGQWVWRTEPAQARPSAYDMLLASMDAPASEEDVALSMLDDEIRSLELTVSDPSAGLAADDALYHDTLDDSEQLLAELEADMSAS